VLLVAVFGGASALAPSSALAVNGWAPPLSADLPLDSPDLSCVSSTWCMAVGDGGSAGLVASSWNGGGWSTPSEIDPSGFLGESVGCAARSWCVAGDSYGGWRTFDGSAWSSLAAGPTGGLSQIDCPTVGFCAASNDSANELQTFNGSSWSTIAGFPGTTLSSLSCSSSALCAMIGSFGDVYVEDDGSWSAAVHINASAVACVPGANFCAAIADGEGYTFDGTNWSSPAPIDALDGDRQSISCGSANFCVATGSDDAIVYSGTWGSAQSLDVGDRAIVSVSCTAQDFCIAANGVGAGLVFAAGAWTDDSIGGGIAAASCASSSFCVAVDQTGRVLSYDGSGWTAPSKVDGNDALDAVSCPTSSFCAAVDTSGNALTDEGGSWSAPELISPSDQLDSVSCVASDFCVAVGAYDGTADAPTFVYNGSAWSPAGRINATQASCGAYDFCMSNGGGQVFDGSSWGAATTTNLIQVACTSTSFCASTAGSNGASGNVTTFNGSTWSQPDDIDGTSALFAMACVANTYCVASDDNGYTLAFSDGTWGPYMETVPNGTFVLLGDISCPTSSFCLAVDQRGGQLLAYEPVVELSGPTTSGQPTVGQTIQGAPGSWLNDPSFGYQWVRCEPSGADCSNISGATAADYTPVAADVGATLRLVVTASNAGGSAPATLSAPTALVTAPPPPTAQFESIISARGRVAARITCQAALAGDCSITLTLTVKEKLRAKRLIAVLAGRQHTTTHERTVTIGATRETLDPGQTVDIVVPLNSTGRRLLKHRHTLSAILAITQQLPGASVPIVQRRVTIR
jgi:hypothetical protein